MFSSARHTPFRQPQSRRVLLGFHLQLMQLRVRLIRNLKVNTSHLQFPGYIRALTLSRGHINELGTRGS